jgi:predicted XRE-type DNA-binding protein
MKTMKNKYIGSNFDDFLAEEALLVDATATALKRVIAWQIEQEMKLQKLTKTAMATNMHTSRAALNRLLDGTDTSLTLTTLASAAAALGKRVRVELSATPMAQQKPTPTKQPPAASKASAMRSAKPRAWTITPTTTSKKSPTALPSIPRPM